MWPPWVLARSQIRVYYEGRAESQIITRHAYCLLFTKLFKPKKQGSDKLKEKRTDKKKSAVKRRQNGGKTAANQRRISGWEKISCELDLVRVFWTKKLRFLEKNYNIITQRRILTRVFWLVWKIYWFFRLSVKRKKALVSSLVDLETSKYRFWGFIFWFFWRILKFKKVTKNQYTSSS
jgi:hypothetical protein